MFYKWSSLESLNLLSFKITSIIHIMDEMFYNCNSLGIKIISDDNSLNKEI